MLNKLLDEVYWPEEGIDEMRGLIYQGRKAKDMYSAPSNDKKFKLYLSIVLLEHSFYALSGVYMLKPLGIESVEKVKSYMREFCGEQVYNIACQFFLLHLRKLSLVSDSDTEEMEMILEFLSETKNIQEILDVFYLYNQLVKEI